MQESKFLDCQKAGKNGALASEVLVQTDTVGPQGHSLLSFRSDSLVVDYDPG